MPTKLPNNIAGANGVVQLPRRWIVQPPRSIYGGPYRSAPRDVFGVCLLERKPDRPCSVWLPIRDFSVPEKREDVEQALRETLNGLLNGRTVYVGCQGGFGRTGLFLSLVAKSWGIKDAVAFVRACYDRRAVETKEQERYVADFNVRAIRGWLLHRSASRALHVWPTEIRTTLHNLIAEAKG